MENNNPIINNELSQNHLSKSSYEICYDLMKEEYKIERDRTRVIENKAHWFLAISIAILPFISNLLSLTKIVNFFTKINDFI